jgi:hypothetical protein
MHLSPSVWLVPSLALGIAASGCGGSARWVVRDDAGGLLALDGERAAAREDARRKIAEHCGAREALVVFEGEVPVRDEETHQRSTEDRIAQTQQVQSGDHTSWVEGQPAYGESGVTFAVGGDPTLYGTEHADRHRVTSTHMETRIEYECEEDADVDDGEPEETEESDEVAVTEAD